MLNSAWHISLRWHCHSCSCGPCNQTGKFTWSVFFSKALSYSLMLHLHTPLIYSSSTFTLCSFFTNIAWVFFKWVQQVVVFMGLPFVPFVDTFSTRAADCITAASAWIWETISQWGFASFSLQAGWQWCMRRLLWASVGLLPLPTDTAITSGFVTAYRRSYQSWAFCFGDRCSSPILSSKWSHWTLISYGSIMLFFQFSCK